MSESGLITWLTHNFPTGFKTEEEFAKIQAKLRSSFEKMCESNGLLIHFLIQTRKGISSILRNPQNGRFVFADLSDMLFSHNGRWYVMAQLYGMNHEKDYCRGANHYCPWGKLGECAKKLSEDDSQYKPAHLDPPVRRNENEY